MSEKFSSRTKKTQTNRQVKLDTKLSWVMGIQFCSNEEPPPHLRRNNSASFKYIDEVKLTKFDILLLGQFQPNLTQTILVQMGCKS